MELDTELKEYALSCMPSKVDPKLREVKEFVSFLDQFFRAADFKPMVERYEKLDLPDATKQRIVSSATIDIHHYGERLFDRVRETTILQDVEDFRENIKLHLGSQDALLEQLDEMEENIKKIEPVMRREMFLFERLKIYNAIFVTLQVTIPGQEFNFCPDTVQFERYRDNPRPVSQLIEHVVLDTMRYQIVCRMDGPVMVFQFFEDSKDFFYKENWEWLKEARWQRNLPKN